MSMGYYDDYLPRPTDAKIMNFETCMSTSIPGLL